MSALPSGTTTATAKLIQRALNEKTGSTLGIDGSFGPQSVAALSVFQNQNGLPITGVYDAATQALLAPFIASKYLTLTSYQQAAQELGTDAATVETVCQVETSGSGFNNNGSCVILFERYQFYRTLLTVLPQATVNTIVAQNPNLCNTSSGGYQGGASEWNRLHAAQAICTQYGVSPDLALRCASWGLFQIMGYYYILEYRRLHECDAGERSQPARSLRELREGHERRQHAARARLAQLGELCHAVQWRERTRAE
jgi:hypothetical protein